MGTNFIVVAISSGTAILVAAFTYYTTKQREREAEWRREKLTHYKDYFAHWLKPSAKTFRPMRGHDTV